MKSGVKKIFSAFRKPDSSGRNIILTGIPRSGTTLACKLLGETPGTIGLNEPMARELFPNPQGAVTEIEKAFLRFRKSLLRSGVAKARTQSGQITDNAYSGEKGQRKRQVERTEVFFNKELKKDFTLIMKHCAEFTLILPALTDQFECYAIIRNPLAILGSWMSVNVPVSRGKVAKSARLNPDFHHGYQQIPNLLERKLFILSWYFGQYKGLHPEQVIRYEDMVSNNPKALFPITNPYKSPTVPLENKNQHALYDREKLIQVADLLLKSEGNYWHFYSKSAVESLLSKLKAS